MLADMGKCVIESRVRMEGLSEADAGIVANDWANARSHMELVLRTKTAFGDSCLGSCAAWVTTPGTWLANVAALLSIFMIARRTQPCSTAPQCGSCIKDPS